eukprot:CAMPEP_0119343118 /NCGR_PEP_ID=MMETSP1333-20130426/106199_1 /TAXON_ID=418940 /ORGANISM="Scyphosphaera apsteinii, Strain RCC1455" /LENGTH=94 /DNA_ID=CAMNT_0007355477 /DNA_START=1 /DNA_END=285 /DNA_ORIENTATION=+
MGSYRPAMHTAAVGAFILAGFDLLALAKPELLEAIVRRAPTMEQLLVRRQREGYFSLSGRVLRRFCCQCLSPAPEELSQLNQANPIETAALPAH